MTQELLFQFSDLQVEAKKQKQSIINLLQDDSKQSRKKLDKIFCDRKSDRQKALNYIEQDNFSILNQSNLFASTRLGIIAHYLTVKKDLTISDARFVFLAIREKNYCHDAINIIALWVNFCATTGEKKLVKEKLLANLKSEFSRENESALNYLLANNAHIGNEEIDVIIAAMKKSGLSKPKQLGLQVLCQHQDLLRPVQQEFVIEYAIKKLNDQDYDLSEQAHRSLVSLTAGLSNSALKQWINKIHQHTEYNTRAITQMIAQKPETRLKIFFPNVLRALQNSLGTTYQYRQYWEKCYVVDELTELQQFFGPFESKQFALAILNILTEKKNDSKNNPLQNKALNAAVQIQDTLNHPQKEYVKRILIEMIILTSEDSQKNVYATPAYVLKKAAYPLLQQMTDNETDYLPEYAIELLLKNLSHDNPNIRYQTLKRCCQIRAYTSLPNILVEAIVNRGHDTDKKIHSYWTRKIRFFSEDMFSLSEIKEQVIELLFKEVTYNPYVANASLCVAELDAEMQAQNSFENNIQLQINLKDALNSLTCFSGRLSLEQKSVLKTKILPCLCHPHEPARQATIHCWQSFDFDVDENVISELASNLDNKDEDVQHAALRSLNDFNTAIPEQSHEPILRKINKVFYETRRLDVKEKVLLLMQNFKNLVTDTNATNICYYFRKRFIFTSCVLNWLIAFKDKIDEDEIEKAKRAVVTAKINHSYIGDGCPNEVFSFLFDKVNATKSFKLTEVVDGDMIKFDVLSMNWPKISSKVHVWNDLEKSLNTFIPERYKTGVFNLKCDLGVHLNSIQEFSISTKPTF